MGQSDEFLVVGLGWLDRALGVLVAYGLLGWPAFRFKVCARELNELLQDVR